jgi:hypothetical protein
MKKKLIVLSGLVLASAPMVALAQVTGGGTACLGRAGGGTPNTADGLIGALCKINEILNIIIPILITLGVVYFIWGVITYVIADDEERKKSGRNRIIYGIIGLAVIVALWGLVAILTNTFGVSNTGTITLPTIN